MHAPFAEAKKRAPILCLVSWAFTTHLRTQNNTPSSPHAYGCVSATPTPKSKSSSFGVGAAFPHSSGHRAYTLTHTTKTKPTQKTQRLLLPHARAKNKTHLHLKVFPQKQPKTPARAHTTLSVSHHTAPPPLVHHPATPSLGPFFSVRKPTVFGQGAVISTCPKLCPSRLLVCAVDYTLSPTCFVLRPPPCVWQNIHTLRRVCMRARTHKNRMHLFLLARCVSPFPLACARRRGNKKQGNIHSLFISLYKTCPKL